MRMPRPLVALALADSASAIDDEADAGFQRRPHAAADADEAEELRRISSRRGLARRRGDGQRGRREGVASVFDASSGRSSTRVSRPRATPPPRWRPSHGIDGASFKLLWKRWSERLRPDIQGPRVEFALGVPVWLREVNINTHLKLFLTDAKTVTVV